MRIPPPRIGRMLAIADTPAPVDNNRARRANFARGVLDRFLCRLPELAGLVRYLTCTG